MLQIARTWAATDACGNTGTCRQTITVNDAEPPAITSSPADVVIEYPAEPVFGTPVFTDNFDPNVVVTFADVSTPGNGLDTVIRTVTRTWTAIDECGNVAQASQTITVSDTTAPALTIPADILLECPADTSTRNTGMATAEDVGGIVTISFNDVVNENCVGNKMIARTWTAIDGCGNRSTGVQSITIADIIKPALIAPPDMVFQCGADTSTWNAGLATAVDGCSQTTVTYSDVVSNSCGSAKVIARTWTAIDECGNRSTAVQMITVEDTERPTLACPANVVLEAPGDTSTGQTGVATAQDGCSKATVSYADSVSNPCAGSTRHYTNLDRPG